MSTDSLVHLDPADVAFLTELGRQFDEERLCIEAYRQAEPTIRPMLTDDEQVVLGWLTAHANDDGMVIAGFAAIRNGVAPKYTDAPLKVQAEIDARVRAALATLDEYGLAVKRTRKLKGANGYLPCAYFLRVRLAA